MHFEDLRSAAVPGPSQASRKFDPNEGAFGPYVRLWIKGEMTALFKATDDAGLWPCEVAHYLARR